MNKKKASLFYRYISVSYVKIYCELIFLLITLLINKYTQLDKIWSLFDGVADDIDSVVDAALVAPLLVEQRFYLHQLLQKLVDHGYNLMY